MTRTNSSYSSTKKLPTEKSSAEKPLAEKPPAEKPPAEKLLAKEQKSLSLSTLSDPQTRRDFLGLGLKWLGLSLLIPSFTGLTRLDSLHARSSRRKKPINSNDHIRILLYEGRPLPKSFPFTLTPKGILYQDKLFKPINSSYGQTVEVMVEDSLPLKVDGNAYSGKIIIVKQKDQYAVINELDLDSYLMGVVKKEISSSWPHEAIRTQSIAARSYAFNHLSVNPQALHHMTATSVHQVFGGSANIPESIRKGVISTHDEILIDRSSKMPIKSFFHATCGGMTEKAENAWPSDERFRSFKHVRCPHCTTHPLYEWERSFPRSEIHQDISQLFTSKVKSIRIASRTGSKRVKELQVRTSDGVKHLIGGDKFRQKTHPQKIPSTRFNLQLKGDQYVLTGKGYGHGVGLCQWGTKTMAEKKYNAKSIINFYYQNCSTITIEKYMRRYASRHQEA